jgi:predicted 3-demethylubiquinone-9 3-methyltransferase (glyoxalase superfamily)
MANDPKVMTCLWFDANGEDAATFYVSLLPGSRIGHVSRYGKDGRMPEGLAIVVRFDLAGTPYMALNGGPIFKQSEATSIVVQCDDQAEIDRLWSALTADGGKESMCGWLKDRFGVSWQIVPSRLGEWMSNADPAVGARVMAAFMGMKKLNIAALEKAARG